MRNAIDFLQRSAQNRWFRLVCSIALACVLASILLFMPVTAGRVLHVPVPATLQSAAESSLLRSGTHSKGTIELPLPFGVEIARATGGLTITKRADLTSVDQGGTLTYILAITNNSGVDMTDITVIDTVPDNAECLDVDAPPKWFASTPENCRNDRLAAWVLIEPTPPGNPVIGGYLADGASVVLTYSVSVDQPLPDQSTIINAASSYAITATTPTTYTDSGTMGVTTIVNAPEWHIGKSATPAPSVQAGDYLTYTIRASNEGHLEATGLYTITDTIPDYTTYYTSTPPATQVGNLLTWAFSETLAVGAGRTVTYVVQVTEPLTDGLPIVNDTYAVTGGNVYTGAIGNPFITFVAAPELHISKADYIDPIWPGGTLTYTLAYSNTGGAPATDVIITDTIDGNTTLVDSSPPVSGSLGSSYYWNIGDLAADETSSIVITVSVASPLPSGTELTNTVDIASPQGYADQDIETTTVLGTPELHLVKEANTTIAEPGDLITYTLSYSNGGDAPAVGVRITDTIDGNTTFVDSDPPYDSGSYVWDIGDLWPSATYQITLTVRVTDVLPNGTVLANDAIIWGTGNITDSDQALVTVQSAPVLNLVKEAGASIIEPGDTLTYTIWYSNTGNAPATGVALTDTLPAELHFRSADPMPDDPPGGGDPWQAWDLGTVGVGGLYSITLVVTSDNTIADNTQLINQVTMSSAETTTAMAEGTVTVYAVDLEVDKTASSSIVKANELVTYTITVWNRGHAVADNVRITDTLPVSIVQSSVFSSTGPGVALDSATYPTYVWITPTLGGLSQFNITIGGRLVTSPWSTSGDVFSNMVEVSSDDTEADLSDNTDQLPTTGRPGDPYTITITPALTETTVGTNVPVTATVKDQFGNLAWDGTAINFSSVPAGSSVAPPSPTTSGGLATTNLSSVVSATVTITGATGTGGTVTDSAEVIFHPGPLDHFAIDVSDPQTAGIAFTLVITALDQYGNVVDFNDTVALTDTTRTLDPTISPSLVNGQGSFSVTVYSATPADVITATWGITPIIGTSDFAVLPGDPAALAVTVGSTALRVCQTTAVTTTVTDQWGNLVPSQPVTLTVFSFGGTANLSPSTGNTGPTGIFNSTLQATGAGDIRIYGESEGGTPNNGSSMPPVTISEPAIPTSLTLGVAPDPLYTGGATAVVTATVSDCQGLSAGQVVTFTLSDISLAWFPGLSDTYTATTNASGVATATLTSNSTGIDGTLLITGRVEGLAEVIPLNVDIPPTPALTIIKTANPSGGDIRPGQPLTYTLITRNVGGAEATNVVISDTLPAGVGLVFRTTSAGTIVSDSPLNVDVGTLAAGDAVTVTVGVTVTAEISGTTLSNQATVNSDQTGLDFSQVVSHQVITGTAVAVYLPIILSNWTGSAGPTPTNANLIIEDIGFSGDTPTNDGDTYHVQVTVRNIGTDTVTSDFWVDLYLNPVSMPAPNQLWQNLSQSGEQGVSKCLEDPTCYGRAWLVTTDLAPGQAVVLATQTAPDPRYSRWPTDGVPYVSSRHNPMVALVDSWGASYGAVYENNETDNLSGAISGAGTIGSQSVLVLPSVPARPAGGKRPSLPGPIE